MGPNPNGPLSKLLEPIDINRYLGLGVRNPWVLLEISWKDAKQIFFNGALLKLLLDLLPCAISKL